MIPVKVRPREVFAAGLALIIISYNNFPQRTLQQKSRFLLRRTAGNPRANFRRANALGGAVYFDGSSSAGSSNITNQGSAASGAWGGTTTFLSTSTAGSSTLTAQAGTGDGYGGGIWISDDADGGSARVACNGQQPTVLFVNPAPGFTYYTIDAGPKALAALIVAHGPGGHIEPMGSPVPRMLDLQLRMRLLAMDCPKDWQILGRA